MQRVEVRPDSPECTKVPGEHRALGEAISYAFEDEGCGFVIASSEDVIVSDDVLRYFAWARRWKDTGPGEILLVNAHNELGQGWHEWHDDAAAAQEAVSIRPSFNPWCWGTWRQAWRQVIEPAWDWDCTSGEAATERGWDWQVKRIVHGELPGGKPWTAVTPLASRAMNIGQYGGIYADPQKYPRTRARSFRARRPGCSYQLVP